MPKVAAVVVLFNPELNVLANINSYIDQVDKLFVVDNSDKINESVTEKISLLQKTEYISNKTNLGIAAALNIGAQEAIVEGFNYLLTMDQDSEASPLMVSKLMDCLTKGTNIALAAPVLYHPEGRKIVQDSVMPFEQTITAWTSGSLLELSIFKSSGGFKEDLFIDYVDHEFCLRLNKMGYKIYMCNNTRLKHNLGKIEEVNLIFRKVYTTNHSPLRLYYRTRNRFYVRRVYKNAIPHFFKQDNKDFWRSAVKVMLFEKDRLKKLRFMLKGYRDFRKNIFGKYNGKMVIILITVLIYY